MSRSGKDVPLVGEFSVDTAASGAAFGIAVQTNGSDVRLAAVDDNLNTLDIWTTHVGSGSGRGG